jgi:hypothetical protein
MQCALTRSIVAGKPKPYSYTRPAPPPRHAAACPPPPPSSLCVQVGHVKTSSSGFQPSLPNTAKRFHCNAKEQTGTSPGGNPIYTIYYNDMATLMFNSGGQSLQQCPSLPRFRFVSFLLFVSCFHLIFSRPTLHDLCVCVCLRFHCSLFLARYKLRTHVRTNLHPPVFLFFHTPPHSPFSRRPSPPAFDCDTQRTQSTGSSIAAQRACLATALSSRCSFFTSSQRA